MATTSEAKAIDLLIVQGVSNDTERATIPFSLAQNAVQKHKKVVEVVLMFDGSNLAIPGNAEKIVAGKPFEGDLLKRIQLCIDLGVKVSVCKPCLMKRKLLDAKLIDQVKIVTGNDVLSKTWAASKVLTFT
eukprot:CAMPEP_0114511358 /NCGR_PEP_ID=MMETSP0109-20121206/14321_1 /TAXON_ID=29199 /ORGANISM="Chlorarachnion reptans, Strain CCCM449" /LENGTH=130 /DNA_ID=CAMNT_0001690813 /DNA_START=22 /DNA_END=414 /DNA_ORIENTATION=-